MRAIFRHRLFKSSLISMFGTLTAGGLGYLFHFWISKRMDVSQYGELQTLLSLFSIFGVFASAVMYLVVRPASDLSLEKDHDATRNLSRWFYQKILSILFVALVALQPFTPLLAAYFHFSDSYGVMTILLASFFFVLSGIDKGILLGWRGFGEISAVNIANALIKLIFGILLVYYIAQASVVFASLLAASLFSWLLAVFLRRRKIGKKSVAGQREEAAISALSKAEMKRVVLKVLVFSGLLVVLTGIDIILMKHFADPVLAGRYSALSLMGNLVFWINSAIILVILPESLNARQKLSKNLQLFSYASITLLSLAMFLFYFLFAQPILTLLFTTGYSEYASSLWLFALIAMFLSFLNLEANFAFARNDFSISYIFIGVLVAIYVSIAYLHDSIMQVGIALALIFLSGFAAALLLRLFQRNMVFENKNLPPDRVR